LLPAALAQPRGGRRVEPCEERARRPDARLEGLPPAVEGGVLDPGGKRGGLDVGAADGGQQLREVALAAAGEAGFVRRVELKRMRRSPERGHRRATARVIPDRR